MKILIASHNQGKIKEFIPLLQPLGLEIVTLSDYPNLEEVEETGSTFAENAVLKAQTISNNLNILALADDSGLVVPVLNGEPGIYSARYSGIPKDDQRNNDKLLDKLKNYSGEDRKAYFISSIAVTYPGHSPLVAEGQVVGYILNELVGHDGFGYDPLFYYPPLKKTFAELETLEKNKISHRGKAIQILQEGLPSWLERIIIE